MTEEAPDAIEARYGESGYGQFKADVGDAVVAAVEPVQQAFRELRGDPGELLRLLAVGADKAREVSAPTLEDMYRKMGFVRFG
jgi:tryptophanyl-tRNA synthetase